MYGETVEKQYGNSIQSDPVLEVRQEVFLMLFHVDQNHIS